MIYVCMHVCTYLHNAMCYICICTYTYVYKITFIVYTFLKKIKQGAVRWFGHRKAVWLPALRFYFIKQTWFHYLMIAIILILPQLATLGVPNNEAYLQSGRSSSLPVILEDLVRCLMYFFRTDWTVWLVHFIKNSKHQTE